MNNIDQSSSISPSEENDKLETSIHDEFIEYMEGDESNFSIWIGDIAKEAKIIVQGCDDGDRDNLMYNLPFASYFRKLCKMILMWSAICCTIFDSPYETSSSANVECDFKNVKLALNDIIPCSVDVFVQHHLDMTDGAIKRASQKYLKFIGESESESADGGDLEYFDEEDSEPCADAASNKSSRKPVVNDRNKRSRKTAVNEFPKKRSRKTVANELPKKRLRKTVVIEFPKHSDPAENSDVEYSDEYDSISSDESVKNKRPQKTVFNDLPKHIEANLEPECVACKNNDLPTGAHTCLICEKNVHILPGCSISIGEEKEGYGETRVCCFCSQKSSTECSNKVTGSTSSLRRTQKTGSTVVNDLPKHIEANSEPGCVACKTNIPTGAHTCIICEKNVHILSGCSISIGGEGLGETRMCYSCHQTSSMECPEAVTDSTKSLRRTTKTESTKSSQLPKKRNGAATSNELNYTEDWNKKQKRKIKQSIYTRPSPYWDLITNVDKKIKLGFLSNGNLSKTIHHVNKVPVSVKNTCAFDSVTQVCITQF